MGRVEPTGNANERRGSEQPIQAERGRDAGSSRRDELNIGHTPTKAEGDENTIDEALKNQK